MSTEHPEQPKAVPLYYAVLSGLRWLVEDLIVAYPEDVNARGGYYETPLFAAFAKEDLKVARLLLRDPGNSDCDFDFAWLLLKYNADVDLPNTEGQTPLGLSTANGQLRKCRLLVQQKANVNARDKDGRTPLWTASHHGHLDIVAYLIDSGADVNSADNKGWTPLHAGSDGGDLPLWSSYSSMARTCSSVPSPLWVPLRIALPPLASPGPIRFEKGTQEGTADASASRAAPFVRKKRAHE
ncbi:ankyrin repeat-containing domain protein, partial [Lactarius hengduanensis]